MKDIIAFMKDRAEAVVFKVAAATTVDFDGDESDQESEGTESREYMTT